MTRPTIVLKKLSAKNTPLMAAAFAAIGWHKPEAQYRRYFAEQEAGSRKVIVAWVAGEFAWYGKVGIGD
ncbi:MAG: hypothetical protein ACE5EY_08030 [Anaerolineae bacterium]